jgi:branched-chain amino acid transport system substrate-binding protein
MNAKPKPDVAYFAVHYRELGMIAIQAKKMGFDIQMASNNAYFQDLLKVGGDAVEGLVLQTDFFLEEPTQRFKDFVSRMEKRFGHMPNAMSVRPYDSMYMLAEALKKNSTDRKAIRDALGKVTIRGIVGDLSFDETRDTVSTDYVPLKVQNGKFVVWK